MRSDHRVALVLAIFLFERIRGWRFYQNTLFLPYLLPITVVGLVLSYIFQLSGVLNDFLKLIGLGVLALDWLGSTRWPCDRHVRNCLKDSQVIFSWPYISGRTIRRG
jgi:ABC-type polysaccharide transport system permease subunit